MSCLRRQDGNHVKQMLLESNKFAATTINRRVQISEKYSDRKQTKNFTSVAKLSKRGYTIAIRQSATKLPLFSLYPLPLRLLTTTPVRRHAFLPLFFVVVLFLILSDIDSMHFLTFFNTCERLQSNVYSCQHQK